MKPANRRLKGKRVENEIVALLAEHGLDAERVPLSGAAGGSFKDDVLVRLAGRLLRVEVKARQTGEGFATLARWLEGSSMLVLKQNRRPALAVLELDLLAELLANVERAHGKVQERQEAGAAPEILDGHGDGAAAGDARAGHEP